MVKILSITDANAIKIACEFLEAGIPIAIPTETVYGLAVDSRNPLAIRRLYEIKKRPLFNPLICHVADISMACKYVNFDPVSLRLAKAFWPGPLTLNLPLSSHNTIHPLATANLKTICIRVPCGFSNKLILAYNYPLTIPSANLSGRISLTCAKDIQATFGDNVPLILDGGNSKIGLESTIIKVKLDGQLQMLRPGGLEAEKIEDISETKIDRAYLSISDISKIESPGTLKSHYAPRALVRLEATHVNPGEALIRFKNMSIRNIENASLILDLSVSGNLKEAAANLFAYMKIADDTGVSSIAFTKIPNHGIGEAINDRLTRAAAPRN
ncbi:YrdC/Sua5 family protein [Liberibacter crescens BT-1]|uniref:Threonylcarbamoyl-AMP synthase n=1 Tax=Liberibacter crescens (strain BT-1) TaxID=1215343 RepID=L0ERF3_LIBCB|nr:L-threonylcarbamoyladenylate synthase [Liberibacter crescens]AGA64054.1 YrdC/Sua5 family protein [Liberibacter crescens BT-1]AMC12355.1 translation factor Sua5 [Liberibacter crescens]